MLLVGHVVNSQGTSATDIFIGVGVLVLAAFITGTGAYIVNTLRDATINNKLAAQQLVDHDRRLNRLEDWQDSFLSIPHPRRGD